jgi:hypothetical protein
MCSLKNNCTLMTTVGDMLTEWSRLMYGTCPLCRICLRWGGGRPTVVNAHCAGHSRRVGHAHCATCPLCRTCKLCELGTPWGHVHCAHSAESALCSKFAHCAVRAHFVDYAHCVISTVRYMPTLQDVSTVWDVPTVRV